jgi:hypothetical protein
MFNKQPLDDTNPYTAGWTRPKMLRALSETLIYLTDTELKNIVVQITVIQNKRKVVQQEHAQQQSRSE